MGLNIFSQNIWAFKKIFGMELKMSFWRKTCGVFKGPVLLISSYCNLNPVLSAFLTGLSELGSAKYYFHIIWIAIKTASRLNRIREWQHLKCSNILLLKIYKTVLYKTTNTPIHYLHKTWSNSTHFQVIKILDGQILETRRQLKKTTRPWWKDCH